MKGIQLPLKHNKGGKIGRYHTRADFLHGHCFYLGFCQPARDVERRIKETAKYIADANALADYSSHLPQPLLSDKLPRERRQANFAFFLA